MSNQQMKVGTYPTHATKRDTPIAKRPTTAPTAFTVPQHQPIQREEPAVEEEDDADKTHPMPEGWFKDHDMLHSRD